MLSFIRAAAVMVTMAGPIHHRLLPWLSVTLQNLTI